MVVVGETPQAAWDGASAIDVDYEELDVVADIQTALQPGAPLVWPNGIPEMNLMSAETMVPKKRHQIWNFPLMSIQRVHGAMWKGFAEPMWCWSENIAQGLFIRAIWSLKSV